MYQEFVNLPRNLFSRFLETSGFILTLRLDGGKIFLLEQRIAGVQVLMIGTYTRTPDTYTTKTVMIIL